MSDAASTHRSPGQVARSEPVKKGARVGIAANGVLHLLIAWLAIQVALGGGGQKVNQGGALTAIAAEPFGKVLLWVLFLGFVCVVLWRATSAVWGFTYITDEKKRLQKRVVNAGQAVIYAVLAA